PFKCMKGCPQMSGPQFRSIPADEHNAGSPIAEALPNSFFHSLAQVALPLPFNLDVLSQPSANRLRLRRISHVSRQGKGTRRGKPLRLAQSVADHCPVKLSRSMLPQRRDEAGFDRFGLRILEHQDKLV